MSFNTIGMSSKYKKKYTKKTTKSKTKIMSQKSDSSKSITDYFPMETKQKLPTIHVYTDGSTVDNGKISAKGGYGVFFKDKDPRNISEPFFIYPITNNRCELYGCIQALQILAKTENMKIKKRVIINTDSEYIVNSMTKWLPAWKMRGWKKADKKPVENRDLLFWLDKLIHLYQGFLEVKFNHVNAAHDYSEPKDKKSMEWQHWYGNDEADKLAKRGTTISIQLEKVTGQ